MHVLWKHESILVAGITQELDGALELSAVTIYLKRLKSRNLASSRPDPARLNRDLWRAEVTLEQMVTAETELYFSRTLQNNPEAIRLVRDLAERRLAGAPR